MVWRTRLLLAVCLVATCTSPGLAQVASSEIFGKVTDTTRAAMPGVTVTIETSPALIQPMSATATVTGAYRFPSVAIGTYTVTFELPGFQRFVREGVMITGGFSAEIDAQLEVSSVEKTVIVRGQSPMVDTKSTTLAANFTRDMLENIPSARDPWAILEQTPGVVMDRQNIGGNASGQQPSFLARGSSSNQMWNLDGAAITDMASGGSPAHHNFDSFEEIQIQTGGADASIEAGGVSINMITKSGGNRFKGSVHFNNTNQQFESQNVTDAQRLQGASSGNPIQDIIEYGGDAGGPIRKGKAWWWTALSRNDVKVGVVGFYKPTPECQAVRIALASNPLAHSAKETRGCYMTDATNLENVDIKVQYQWTRAHKTTAYWGKDAKYRNTRGASATVQPEATHRQTTPGIGRYYIWQQWVASDRLMFEGKYTFYDNNLTLDFHEDRLKDVQGTYDINTGVYARSGDRIEYIRPTTDANIEGNYFLSDVLGGDHATKFGFRYKRTPNKQISTQGGGVLARFNDGVPYQVSVIRDGFSSRDMWEYSAYFNDSFKVKRVTLNAGVRWDYQDDKALKAGIPANRLLPDLLPAVDFKGADSGAHYSNVSPRIGMTYDLSGNGKTVVKANFARYWGLGIYTAGTLMPTGSTTLRYWWNDLNGDGFVTRDEIDFTRGFASTPSSNYDAASPSAVKTPASVDPKLKNDVTDEFVAGIDRELMPNFGIGVQYIWRTYGQFQTTFYTNADGTLVSSDTYSPVTFSAACGNIADGQPTCDAASYSGTYFQRATALPRTTVLRNYGAYRKHQGLEVTARKRTADRWMLNFAITYNDTRYYYGQPTRDYRDPTNVALREGLQTGTMNVRWVGKLSGLYVLPWGLTTSAFLNCRQGFPFNRTILSPSRTGSGGQVSVLVKPNNTERLPNFCQLDWRVDKAFNFSRFKVLIVASVFNIFNNNVVLGRTAQQNSTRANNVTDILAPRVARFDFRITF